MTLEGEVALVTGASRGIGQAVAKRLARAGARVVGTATSTEGARAIGEALVEEVSASVGPITVLVNNAGITRDTLLLRMKDSDWAEVIDTDLSAVFRLSRAVLRGMMKARRGRIISIGSVVGTRGNAGQANYCAAKAGLVGFSKALAREIGSRNVTVNVVAPGFIDTDMTKALGETAHAALLEQIPLERLGQAEDIAAAVAFLASRDAGYITGETLHVNGGLYMA